MYNGSALYIITSRLRKNKRDLQNFVFSLSLGINPSVNLRTWETNEKDCRGRTIAETMAGLLQLMMGTLTLQPWTGDALFAQLEHAGRHAIELGPHGTIDCDSAPPSWLKPKERAKRKAKRGCSVPVGANDRLLRGEIPTAGTNQTELNPSNCAFGTLRFLFLFSPLIFPPAPTTSSMHFYACLIPFFGLPPPSTSQSYSMPPTLTSGWKHSICS
ncbi:uncharacterized protein BP01DRAFT_146917 [Aspergillus saccharolyticus JOP 1030-1]|uniref:Uncharacterized protein n=1 Tax=Aspergillus saccharolyticus JOP 1030-1 TaxID=1450539 RepID=A0A319A9L1_9EURO|nr:hypothetical protein BP01DRAFT_146917 [Aspergillus saccharolyticus JOP 1030-1]PYH48388.1 hypothetical protein BP01DRAFT_146917 [Aspergillus saccharolyticus JOP 1030-1]